MGGGVLIIKCAGITGGLSGWWGVLFIKANYLANWYADTVQESDV